MYHAHPFPARLDRATIDAMLPGVVELIDRTAGAS